MGVHGRYGNQCNLKSTVIDCSLILKFDLVRMVRPRDDALTSSLPIQRHQTATNQRSHPIAELTRDRGQCVMNNSSMAMACSLVRVCCVLGFRYPFSLSFRLHVNKEKFYCILFLNGL